MKTNIKEVIARDLSTRVNRSRILPGYLIRGIYIDVIAYLQTVKYQQSHGFY